MNILISLVFILADETGLQLFFRIFSFLDCTDLMFEQQKLHAYCNVKNAVTTSRHL